MTSNDNNEGRVLMPWERTFERILTPFEEFIHNQTTGGILLLSAAVIALIVANSPLGDAYQHILHAKLGFHIGAWSLSLSLHHWINDGLMTLFFFLVGLEIKRELLVGELSDLRQAAMPAIAALGGMLVPAGLYVLLTPAGPAASGWGIPMATDIAFAVSALVILGRRIPSGLMAFLVALAIVDDLGAVAVIAVFYTNEVNLIMLGVSVGLFALMVVFNLGGIRHPLPYFIVGTLLWLAMLQSGIHATIAGVLMALAIPSTPEYDPPRFSRTIADLMKRFDSSHREDRNILANQTQFSVLAAIETNARHAATPLQRLEHGLHHPVGLIIMPIFALANAGIPLGLDQLAAALHSPITLGVAAGLVLGKLIGVVGFTWLAVRLGVGRLPVGTNFRHIVGVGLLAGIGFTMSIFISELAFVGNEQALVYAKSGILVASLVAGIGGYLWLRLLVPAPAHAAPNPTAH
ncbi:Na+/H+ antiporter NhaA [Acidihalobacter ferrooxydans]|uniref:Na(+)/H(+) antiporter NhaA n=1 Tax=Acidihalobacter ferrooxydans TaxID=1765967 RepID=A0A1P8UKV9_9GAMM|nr:Na+/H+ antiporter NhaA [Acidihalobacter ferrooxydans]APZ44487.1 Na+/H+ antiporter NhaA [Acidihalobacter ferrooxydans]